MNTDAVDVKARFLALLPTAESFEGGTGKGSKEEKKAVKQKKSETAGKADAVPEEQKVRGVEALLPLVQNDPLYVGDDCTGYILHNSRLQMLDSKNKELCEDWRLAGYEKNGKVPSRETINAVLDLLSARARRDGAYVELFNRVGQKGGKIYYDMSNGKAIEVAPDSWNVIDAPVMFRQLKHQLPQVAPLQEGDIWRFLDFCELPENQKLLFIVTLVTCFVPKIWHPAIHVNGCQGSGKSIFTKLWKKVIDPSMVLLSTLPRKPEDLDILLVRYYGLVLDNLSFLSADTCDRLCSFITGGVIERRTLHTDTDTTILKANSIIFYSSIGSLHSRPDLTERTIVFDLKRVSAERMMDENDLVAEFEKSLPDILGGCFDLLAKAMKLVPTLTLEKLPRMAGYAKWGFAIAEAIGEGRGEEFLKSYRKNSSIQAGSLLENDTLFASIVQIMDESARNSLSGAFQEIVLILAEVAAPGEASNGYKILDKDKTFPTSRGLRKHLERIRIPLEEFGIQFEFDNKRTNRAKAFVTFEKVEVTKDEDGKSIEQELVQGVPF
jgi:hypothetical protein